MILALGAAAALLLAGDTLRSPSLDSLADETAARIARFAERRVAIAEGYRRVGTDFPGMGEHWLRPASLFSPRPDARHPTILIYATIDGRPTLLGAGYVMTTRGAPSDPVAPGWPAAWHEHSGLIEDESGVDPSRPPAIEDATRVWVLHIWTALENPDGRYVPDNWALPFVRAGLAAPRGADHEAARALSLAVGNGDRYLLKLLADARLLDAGNARAVEAIIGAGRERAEVIVQESRAEGGPNEAQLQSLRETWQTLGVGLRSLLGPGVERLLAPPHRHGASSSP